MADLKYTRTNWKDYPDETTPVNAANLNNIENGIEINKANIDELSQVVNAIDIELDTKEPSISLSPGWTKSYTTSIVSMFDRFTDTTEWSLITDTLTVSKDRVNQYTGTTISNQTEISADHITTTGSISAKAIALNNDVSVTQFSDSFTAEVSADTAPTAQGVVNYVNNMLSSKQDTLTVGNNGIILAGSTISLNTNFIFETLLEYADIYGADIDLSAWINSTSAASYRYFVVDLFIEPNNFSPQHLSSFWISADAVTWGLKTSMVYNLVGYDNLYMENVSVIFHDQVWLSLRNTPATSGTSSGVRYGSVYRIQGVR